MKSRLLIACAVLALAACGKAEQQAAAPEAPVVAAPVPAAPVSRSFDAMSKTAESFTGGLTVASAESAETKGEESLTLTAEQGQVYQAQLVGKTPATATVGAEAWTAVLPIPETALVSIYQVDSETVGDAAKNGGLCGAEKPTVLAVAEFPNAMKENELQIAAFKDVSWPPAAEPQLCGTYTYVEAAGAAKAGAP